MNKRMRYPPETGQVSIRTITKRSLVLELNGNEEGAHVRKLSSPQLGSIRVIHGWDREQLGSLP